MVGEIHFFHGRHCTLYMPKPKHIPEIHVCMAMTADGKIALSNRRGASFGSGRDHDHLLALRSRVDAILCGARTVNSGSITLGPGGKRYRLKRLDNGLQEYPLRIIASATGSLRPDAEIFRQRFSPIIVLTSKAASPIRIAALNKVADKVHCGGTRTVDWKPTLQWLYEDWGVRRILCEGGGQLNGSLLRSGLIDEWHVTVCPWIAGGKTAPTIADGPGWHRLRLATPLRLKSMRQVDGEMFLIYKRAD